MATKAQGFFQPSADAPPGAADRVPLAARSLNAMQFDVLVAWLEDKDGLSDEQRFKWYGKIVRAWRHATREAYELDGPETLAKIEAERASRDAAKKAV